MTSSSIRHLAVGGSGGSSRVPRMPGVTLACRQVKQVPSIFHSSPSDLFHQALNLGGYVGRVRSAPDNLGAENFILLTLVQLNPPSHVSVYISPKTSGKSSSFGRPKSFSHATIPFTGGFFVCPVSQWPYVLEEFRPNLSAVSSWVHPLSNRAILSAIRLAITSPLSKTLLIREFLLPQ